jgi:hypothetical protein
LLWIQKRGPYLQSLEKMSILRIGVQNRSSDAIAPIKKRHTTVCASYLDFYHILLDKPIVIANHINL